MQLRIDALRGGLVESTHPVSAVLVDGGVVRWAVGPDVRTFWRSAAKPFQLATALSFLPAEVVRALDDATLAVGAASHSGQPEHLARVEALLAHFGLEASALQCGAHPPVHEPSAKAVPTPTALHNNCSGKHAFMLAACATQGWALDYRPLTHPLQVANREALDVRAGVAHEVAIDGCSVPTFHAPLSAIARAWATLATELREGEASHLACVGWAMHRAPFFASGSERLDLLVVERASEPLTVKVGAEGLFCVARPSLRQGIAVKVHTGNADALAVAVRAVLERLEVAVPGPWPWAVVRNVRGVEVGERVARWS